MVEALVEAMGHPVRFRLTTVLTEEPGLTVRQISERTNEPPRRIRYQVERLRRAGLIEISSHGKRRGAIEHRYSMTRSTILTDEDFESAAIDTRVRVALEVFRLLVADVSAATRAGTFGVRPGRAEIRTVGEVDDPGWEALAAISLSFYGDIEKVLEEARERLARSGGTGTPVTAALFFFERS